MIRKLEEFKKIYGIDNTYVVLRLLIIKTKLQNEKNVIMSNDELINFITEAMNYGTMQLWLIENSFEGKRLSLNDKLKKFFELKTDEEILHIYDINQNYNEQNIENVLKLINSR